MATPPSWVEISRRALAHNIGVLRDLCEPGTALGPVVKADAYGHGLTLCARVYAAEGASFLCVNEVAEVAAIRAAGVGLPVLVVGPLFEEDAAAVAALGCHVVVWSRAQVRALAGAGAQVPVHVKVETGTNRQGLRPADARDLIAEIQRLPGVRLAGVCTHLADVEDETEHTFAQVQIDRFLGALPPLPPGVLRHCSSSAAHLVLPAARLDLVRPGIACYGIWPSESTRIASRILYGDEVTLRPALRWKTRLSQVRDAPLGEYVGYGRTHRLRRPSRVGVLPVGYYDGYDRGLSGRGWVMVGGRRAPILGRVCMNMTMVDLTDAPEARPGDEVLLLGPGVEAEVLAELLSTIAYEVTTRIQSRLPRIEVP